MTSRLVRVSAVFASLVLISHSRAQSAAAAQPATPPPAVSSTIRPAPPEDEPVQLNFPDADIDTILDVLRTLTGRIILRPQALQIAPNATFNLKITKQIPKTEALLAIETVLAMNNIALAPLGDKFIKVTDAGKVRHEAPEMISGSAFDYPASGKVATKLFQLEFARVAEITPLLSGVINPFFGGLMPLPNANAALITDSISNLQRLEILLQQVDRPITAGMRPKFYGPLRNAKASEVVNKLRTILTGTLTQQLGSATSYNADDRTNQIILVTDPRQHAFFDDLIDKLDQKSDPNTRTDVIGLNHAKAADVVSVLGNIIRGQTTAIQSRGPGSVRPGQVAQPVTPGAPPAPAPQTPTVVSASSGNNSNESANEFSAVMTVVNDDRSNSVVVFGTADDLRLVRELIGKLDIVLAQVRIEVVIAEVTLDDNDTSGISALGLTLEGDKLVGFSGTLRGPSNAATTVSDGAITRTNGNLDLAATISVSSGLRKRNNSIVTVPAIVTSHGKEAKFFNGESRPVVTGSVVSGTVGGVTSSTTQQKIGTTLTVTPYIGVDGSVQLDLTQLVEDVTGEVIIDNNTQYIIGSRETKNYVTAKSGDVIVLGGFRKNSAIRERGRLGPIPILGDIFGPRTRNNGRQEIIFFLRPAVLSNNPTLDNAEAMRRIENMPTRETIKGELNPNYQPSPQPGMGKPRSQ